MSELQILHIADVHLGGSGPAFGARVREHQQRLEDAFAEAMELARFRKVAAVCIVGDLFYSTRPSENTLQMALRELRSLAEVSPPIPCFLIPGNHDCLDAASVYHRPEFRGEFLHTWTKPEPATFRLPDGSLAVHGNPESCGRAKHKPLAGLAPDPSAQFNVALAHGAVLIPGLTEAEAALITPEEIANSGMDYVALGHWHDPSDYSSGGVTARYSGATEIVGIGQKEPGGVLLVTLSDAGARVERLETGTLRCESLELDPEAHQDEAAIAAEIGSRADEDLLLDVRIAGLAPEGFACDLARLQEELEGGFFRLRIEDETVPPLEEADRSGSSEHLIAARAFRMFRERIEQAQSEEDSEGERIARRALQVAAALFEGKEVLQ